MQFYLVYPKAQLLDRFCSFVRELVATLQSECETAINWLYNNKMIVNPVKFQAIFLDKGRYDNTNIEVEIGIHKIRSISSVKLLGVHIDDNLSFNVDINKICKSAGNHLNALIRLKSFLGLTEREVSINSFIYSDFNYCRLVWMLSHEKSLDKIESLRK